MASEHRLAVVILAAGKGTRMKNPDMAKVMYTINERPMVGYVLDVATRLHASPLVVVVGWQKDSVIGYLEQSAGGAVWVEQTPQLGTGHAVMQAAAPLKGFRGDVLILSGDVPLLTLKTAQQLIAVHRMSGAAATVLTAVLDDPTGYGRIVRGSGDRVTAIVEEKDASEAEKQIREINSGIYVFASDRLFEALQHLTPSNVQKEYYLTDAVAYLWRNGLPVTAVTAPDPREILGINTVTQLEAARELMARA